MRNLLIAGCPSPARVLAIGFLDHLAELDFFNPDEIIDSGSKHYKIAVYISESEPDPQVIEELRLVSESIILIAHSDFEDNPSDLFIPIWALGSCPKALAELHKTRDFIDSAYSGRAALSDTQREVLHQLLKGSSEEDILMTLSMSRRGYYIILAQLRGVYGVGKNKHLVLAAQNMELTRAS
jgi:DNA-binding CsgD family transcriptional regulator